MENINLVCSGLKTLVEVYEIPKLKKEIQWLKKYNEYLERTNDIMNDLLKDLADQQEERLNDRPIILTHKTHEMCVFCGDWKKFDKELDYFNTASGQMDLFCASCREKSSWFGSKKSI